MCGGCGKSILSSHEDLQVLAFNNLASPELHICTLPLNYATSKSKENCLVVMYSTFFIRTSSCMLQQLAKLTSYTAGIHCGW